MGDFYPKLFNCCHEGFVRRVKYAFVQKVQYGYQGFLGGNTAFATFRRVRQTICSCATPPWTVTGTGTFAMDPATGDWTQSWSYDGSPGSTCLCGPGMLWWHRVALEDDYFLFECRDGNGVTWYAEEGFLEDEIPDEGANWGLAVLAEWDFSTQPWWTTYNLSTGTGINSPWRDLLLGWGSYGGGTCPMASGGDGIGQFKNVGWYTSGGWPILLPLDGQYAGDFVTSAGFQDVMIVRGWLRVRTGIDTKAPSICVSEVDHTPLPEDWASGSCTLGGMEISLPVSSLAGAGILMVRARDSKANRTGPPMPACCNQPQ